MKNILEQIREYKLREIKANKLETPVSILNEQAANRPPPLAFEEILRNKEKTSFGIIAEIKKASPSRGIIRSDFNVANIAREYELGGASCLSILTDFKSFMGQKQYIKQAREASSLPILRKDFLYDPYQVIETRAIGADCILIIMATVSDQQARELEDCANQWGLDVLVEVHTEHELERALNLKSRLIGINNRDLKTFNIRLDTTIEIAAKVPAGYLIVSESGISNSDDLIKMAKINVRSFLIGESLMREKKIKDAIERLLKTI